MLPPLGLSSPPPAFIAGTPDPFVDAVLAEETASRSASARPQILDDLEDDYFDLIVTLAPEAHHAALELTRTLAVEVEYWPTLDPTATQAARASR